MHGTKKLKEDLKRDLQKQIFPWEIFYEMFFQVLSSPGRSLSYVLRWKHSPEHM